MEIEIRKVKQLNNGFYRLNIAFTTTEFGIIVIKGFRVGRSPNYDDLWIQPPCANVYGKYVELCFFENKELWEQVKNYIKEFYVHQTALEYPPSNSHNKIDIDLDEIDEYFKKEGGDICTSNSIV